MKYWLFLAVVLIVAPAVHAQQKLLSYTPCNGDNYPTPPGTQKAAYQWFDDNRKSVNLGDSGRDQVHIGFSIDVEGNITKAKVFSPLTPEADREALRLIKNMPKWQWKKPLAPIQDCMVIIPVRLGTVQNARQ